MSKFYADKIYADAAMETIHNEWLINQFMIFVIHFFRLIPSSSDINNLFFSCSVVVALFSMSLSKHYELVDILIVWVGRSQMEMKQWKEVAEKINLFIMQLNL